MMSLQHMTTMLHILYFLLISGVLARTSYESCYRTKLGRGYHGKINVTISGRTCQKWGLHTPHHHNFTWLWTEGNYCRNPNDKETGPWCFTTDPNTVLESCGIVQCNSKFDVCLTKPCQNGRCTSYRITQKPYYKCVCLPNWTGYNCETKVPQCQFKPCKNGGKCMEIKDDFMCHCPPNYAGKTCEIKTDRCEDGWRHIGDFCYQISDSFMTWENAKVWCNHQLAKLPVIDSPQMQSAMSRLATEEKSDLWMGIKYLNGDWVYTNYSAFQVPVKTFYWHRLYKNARFKNDSCILLKQADNRTASAHDNWIPISCEMEKKFACRKRQGTCSGGWFYHQNKCYKLLDDLQTSLWNARDQCRKIDSNLLEIHSATDESFLQDFLQLQRTGIGNDGKFWLNLRRNDDSTEKYWKWRWDSSETRRVSYRQFANASNSGECGYMDIDRKGTWHSDAFCSEPFSVVCTHDVGTLNWIFNMKRNIRLDYNRGSSECGKGWVDDKESSCFYFIGELLTWQSAEDKCQQMGAHLISIDDANEQKFITGLIKPDGIWGSVWIGANSRTEGRGFQWTDGGAFVYYNWFPGDPESQIEGDEECVAMFISNSLWTDNSCQQLHSAVCEKMRPFQAKNRASKKTVKMKGSAVNGTCADGWIPYREGCFLIQQRRTTWDEASALCRQQNAHLASIADQDELYLVFSQLPPGVSAKQYGYWIGLRDRRQQTFRWEDNSDVTYTAWQTNDPQGLTLYKEGCTFMNLHNGLWGDRHCDSLMPGYVCRSSKLQNKTNIVSPISVACEKGAVGFNSFCYRIFEIKKTWKEAELMCQSLGGHLATISSLRELYFLASQLELSNPKVWIGYTVIANKSSWSSGKTAVMKLSFVDFGGNLTEKCGFVDKSEGSRFLMALGDCEKKQNFICEEHRDGYKALPPSTASVPMTMSSETCPPGWQTYGNRCFKEFLEKLSWTAARRKCRNIGGRLITIDSGITFSFVFHAFNSVIDANWWIGLNNRARAHGKCGRSCIVWSDNDENPLFRRWESGEPNLVDGTASCVMMSKSNGKFKDYPCFLPSPFICEAKLGSPLLENEMPSTLKHGRWALHNCSKEKGFFCKKRNTARHSKKPQMNNSFTLIDGGCPPNYTASYFNNKCYLYIAKAVAWTVANRTCHSHGDSLLTIGNQLEQDFIVSLMDAASDDVWTGLRENKWNEFTYSDGKPIKYSNWAKDERISHSVYGPIECAVMNHRNSGIGRWRSVNCNTRNPFICEKTKDPSIANKEISLVCPAGYEEYKRRCFKFGESPTDHDAAQSICEQNKGNLASITSVYEYGISRGIAAKYNITTYWIGLRSTNTTAMYRWGDGIPYQFSHWKESEPSQAPGEECVVSDHGEWMDVPCTGNYSYLCEINLDKVVSVRPPSSCMPHGLVFDGACYYMEQKDRSTWKDALLKCRKFGMELVSIHSVTELEVIREYIVRSEEEQVWIGMTNSRKESDLFKSVYWYWSNGEKVNFTHWAINEPSTGILENKKECVEMYHNGFWNDCSCTSKRSFICKHNASAVEPKGISTQPTIEIKTKSVLPPHNILNNVGGTAGKREPLKKSGSSTHVGLIVGTTVGVLVLILIVLIIGLLIYRRRRQPLFRSSLGFANAMFQKENEESNG
ncbi:macrophage mannose receptor 1-like isoform X2 [Ostrea edulis]|uniref:macrophage mannose receptor 1-like isoform X2 n=1 Tax=Ostrea edulis TaxID=37623 RepID=UPI0024AEAA52|nr:macrophage mannose receptor 1-like isoform X2 [Ostrea edulis]